MLKKYRSYALLCKTCVYLDLLEAVGPASKVFQGKVLMIYEVKPTVEMTMMELDEVNSFVTVDNELTMHLSCFYLKDGEVDGTKLNVKMKPEISYWFGYDCVCQISISFIMRESDFSRWRPIAHTCSPT